MYGSWFQNLDATVSELCETFEEVIYTTRSLTRTPRSLQDCSKLIHNHHHPISQATSTSSPNTTAASDTPSNSSYSGYHYATLPTRASTKTTAREQPVPAPRPTLSQLLNNCEEIKGTLNDLQRFTKGTKIYR